MPQHLADAARRRHEQSLQRATNALATLSAAGAPITFASIARKAGISTDFLYRQPVLRSKIQQMHSQPHSPNTAPAPADDTAASQSAPVRALSAQLKELRRNYHAETRRCARHSPSHTAKILCYDENSPPTRPMNPSTSDSVACIGSAGATRRYVVFGPAVPAGPLQSVVEHRISSHRLFLNQPQADEVDT
ncbi:DUF6262 family protein [Mycobacterium sp. 141]|uniref:DUF6262 family protein n=1 Tax=Mycobacterium sp. 141 TaxID=1120797 RepID=UPI0012DD56D5|nr:DUF6262 family protein [Mycobacterium sp. 141]